MTLMTGDDINDASSSDLREVLDMIQQRLKTNAMQGLRAAALVWLRANGYDEMHGLHISLQRAAGGVINAWVTPVDRDGDFIEFDPGAAQSIRATLLAAIDAIEDFGYDQDASAVTVGIQVEVR